MLPLSAPHIPKANPEHGELKPGKHLLADLRSDGIHVAYLFHGFIAIPSIICNRLARAETQTVVQAL